MPGGRPGRRVIADSEILLTRLRDNIGPEHQAEQPRGEHQPASRVAPGVARLEIAHRRPEAQDRQGPGQRIRLNIAAGSIRSIATDQK